MTVSDPRSTDIAEKGEDEREVKDEDEVDEPEEGTVDESGRMDIGNADANHGLSGIDVMTTFGT